MAANDLHAFYEKVAGDEDLQGKLKVIAERQKAIYDDIVQLGADAGFTFTVQEVREATLAPPGELSKEDLEAIAGGGIFCDDKYICGSAGNHPV